MHDKNTKQSHDTEFDGCIRVRGFLSLSSYHSRFSCCAAPASKYSGASSASASNAATPSISAAMDCSDGRAALQSKRASHCATARMVASAIGVGALECVARWSTNRLPPFVNGTERWDFLLDSSGIQCERRFNVPIVPIVPRRSNPNNRCAACERMTEIKMSDFQRVLPSFFHIRLGPIEFVFAFSLLRHGDALN